jgi:hypothetical protein
MTNYHSIRSNINVIEMYTNYYKLHIIQNLLLRQLVSDTIFTWKTYILR